MKTFVLFVSGLSTGFLIAASMFALITTIGIVTRLADKTHTASHIIKYETAITFGGILGNLTFIFRENEYVVNAASHFLMFDKVNLVIYGVFTGIFVGCLATALGEAIKATAVFSRRIRLHANLGFVILSIALGKIAGSYLFFFLNMFKE